LPQAPGEAIVEAYNTDVVSNMRNQFPGPYKSRYNSGEDMVRLESNFL
jgi:hypothetical protein